MSYCLRGGVQFCVADGRAIFVDLSSGRYFCLARDLDEAFRDSLAGELGGGLTDHAVDRLVSGGVFVQGTAQPCRWPALPSPQTAFPVPIGAHVHASTIVRVIFAHLRAIFLLRTRTLSEILVMIESRRNSRSSRTENTFVPVISEINATFRAMNILFPPFGRCLQRSLAFLLVCNQFAIWPKLAIGVRTNPFMAHCWVQDGQTAIFDDSGEVARFTPILAA